MPLLMPLLILSAAAFDTPAPGFDYWLSRAYNRSELVNIVAYPGSMRT